MHNNIAEQAPPFGLGDPECAQRLLPQNGPDDEDETQHQQALVDRTTQYFILRSHAFCFLRIELS